MVKIKYEPHKKLVQLEKKSPNNSTNNNDHIIMTYFSSNQKMRTSLQFNLCKSKRKTNFVAFNFMKLRRSLFNNDDDDDNRNCKQRLLSPRANFVVVSVYFSWREQEISGVGIIIEVLLFLCIFILA